MKSVLVIHSLTRYHRQTTFEFVMCFGRYAPSNTSVHYHNVRNPFPSFHKDSEFDAMILTYDLLALRASSDWPWVLEEVMRYRHQCNKLLAFPQDDYTYNRILDDGLNELDTQVIYTPLESGHETVYPKISQKAEINVALTGYVDTDNLDLYLNSWMPIKDRVVDVGTRVRFLPPYFGREGQIKGRFAENFKKRAEGCSLTVDISTNDLDAFSGQDWYKFLGSVKATIGQKGGASLCDPDGSLMHSVNDFLKIHPDADFDFVEKNCFDGSVQSVGMRAISPRLFDAAMLGTAQILLEDIYLDGMLEPWVHYIPTDIDVSNLDEIIDFLSRTKALQEMVEASAEVLLRSEKFTYKAFVEKVFADSIDISDRQGMIKKKSALCEFQLRATPEMFSLLYTIITTCNESEIVRETLLECIDAAIGLIETDSKLISHLTADLFDYFVIEIPNLGPSKGFVVDFIRECALTGSLDLLSDVIREYSLIEYDDGWKGSFDWSSYDQLELQNYIRGDE